MQEFWKYEGLGNDLVFMRGGPEDPGGRSDPAWIRAVCDRHLGVGADGIMWVRHTPGGPDTAHIHYVNADGSQAEMCGNGLRCAALFLFHEGHVARGEQFSVQMAGSGRKRCIVHDVADIEVEVGSPERGRGAEGHPDRMRLSASGRELTVIPLAVGNPHAVTFDTLTREEMEVIGPELEDHRIFPDRVNVEFATVRGPQRIDLVVWERGCGFTRACGSGACAAATAAAWEGLCGIDEPIEVSLPGGTLRVRLDALENVLWLRGAARRVFQGTLDPAAFGL